MKTLVLSVVLTMANLSLIPAGEVAGNISLSGISATLSEDGFLTPGIWQKAGASSVAFVFCDGSTNAPEAATRLDLALAEGCLCLRFACQDPDAEHLVFSSGLRDTPSLWQDDALEIYFDFSAGDKSRKTRFSINPRGTLLDAVITDATKKGAKGMDAAWDSRARYRSVIGKTGWTAEITIPLADLLPPDGTGPVSARVNFTRVRQGREGGVARRGRQIVGRSVGLGNPDLHDPRGVVDFAIATLHSACSRAPEKRREC